MGLRIWPALPAALSCLSGVLLAATDGSRNIPAAVALLALGLALGKPARAPVSGLALGLISGWMSPPTWAPDSEQPIVLIGRLDGPWSQSAVGPSVLVRGEWVRAGDEIKAWRHRVVLSLPPGSDLPVSHRLRARGFLRRPEPLANGVAISQPAWHLYAKSAYFVEAMPTSGVAPWALRLSARLRARVRAPLAGPGVEGSPGASLIQSLILGESWTLPSAWRRGLQASGLSHLVALSGLHVGLLTAMILGLTFRLPLKARAALVGFLVAGYLLFVGPRPALVRACLMLIAIWIALCLRRSPLPGNILAAVAALMVISSPDLVGNLGFRLTVSATAGIFVLAPILEHRWSRLPAGLRRPLSVTVGAQLSTLPWAIPQFHLFTPLAPLWNLVAVPWTAFALAIGSIWSCIALLSTGVATALMPAVDFVALPFTAVASLPPSVTRPIVVDWGPLEAFTVACLLFAALAFRRIGIPALLLALLMGDTGERIPADGAELVLLDVGQGESILLRHGDHTALLDGGGWRQADIGSRVLLPALASLGVKKLDVLALSHPDVDHCAGLVQVGSFFPVDEVWSASGWRPTGCVADLFALPGVAPRPLWEGETRRIGAWRLEVLNPPPATRQGENDRSLVVLATFDRRRVLLTGDIGASVERRLMRERPEILRRLDVLKLAHHGSRTSSTDAWLEYTRPRLAVVSAGRKSRYRHPSTEVIERLDERRILTLRTDLQGMIRIGIGTEGALRIRLPGVPKPGR